MADTKIGKTGIARRSARTFESDIDIRQAADYGAEAAMSYNRKRGDMEHSQGREKEKLVEVKTRTRSSSTSSTAPVEDDMTDILGGLDKMAHEIDGEGTFRAESNALPNAYLYLQRRG